MCEEDELHALTCLLLAAKFQETYRSTLSIVTLLKFRSCGKKYTKKMVVRNEAKLLRLWEGRDVGEHGVFGLVLGDVVLWICGFVTCEERKGKERKRFFWFVFSFFRLILSFLFWFGVLVFWCLEGVWWLWVVGNIQWEGVVGCGVWSVELCLVVLCSCVLVSIG